MIQAFGLTSNPRKAHPPAVDDVSFEARAGHVTALLGRAGAGKTTALKLMLELQQGRGVTYFRGRPLHQIAHPSWEVGALLGDVPGHPARSLRGHLRMLCAASGVPARRADEVLEAVGLVSLREERLGTLSRGMDRRLGLACALLTDPHTLVLDEPTEGLSTREAQWLHGMLRAHATQGGTVLFTTAQPREAARTADRVVTLDDGRLVADQEAGVFARTRLRPRVAVRSPHAPRLAALLAKDARTARRSVEVVREGGNRLSVYGSTTADIGEIAYRYGILVHQLADEVGDMGPGAGEEEGAGTASGAPRQPVPDAPPAAPGDRSEHGITGRDPVTPDAPRGDRKRVSAARAREGSGHAVPGGAARETAPASAPDAAHAAFAGSPGEPGRDADGTPTKTPAEPEHARPAVPHEAAPPGLPPTGPRATEPSVRPGPAAAESSTATRDRSAPEPRTPAPGRPPAPGHPTERRERTSAGDLPTPGMERTKAGLSPVEEGESATSRTVPERSYGAGGERSARARTLDREPGRDRSVSASGTLPRDVPSAAATSSAGGTTPGGTAPGGRSRTGEVPGNAADGRPTGATARPEGGPGPATTPREPQTGGTGAPAATVTGTRTLLPGARTPGTPPSRTDRTARPDQVRVTAVSSPLPPPISVRAAPSPLRPLRYEIRRATGIGTGFLTCGAALVLSALIAVLLARIGHTPQARLFAAWPRQVPLPPAALAAGLLGALAFGDEFRHPALAADRGTVPRRLGLLTAKLLVSGATAGLLAFLTVGCDAELLYIVYGRELTEVPADWLPLTAGWFGLVVGCAWAGVLAAGVFRSTTAGLAAVLAVPVVVPLVHKVLPGPATRMGAGFPVRMREVLLSQWPFGGDRYLLAAARVLGQPVGRALVLSLAGLLCAYLLTALRTRPR
ncbi:ATP-binding cassette domain-containing protein [Streptomyces sp. NPDC018347]|uniref:ATP-binding cassette domain-containing protein n=1 Tax=Streptomyces sp. NPDC018347 TaxID=3157193 RepID=UPI0033CC5E6F